MTKNKKDAKRVITLYMKALDNTKLPKEVWGKIARVNQLLLDKEK